MTIVIETVRIRVEKPAESFYNLCNKYREDDRHDRKRTAGQVQRRSAGNVNISFRGIEGESLILALDIKGIAASSGSACTSGSIDPSHVLTAIGLNEELAKGSLRLTLGDGNTDEDIDYILEVLPETIKRLRSMSPMWQRICREEGIPDYTV